MPRCRTRIRSSRAPRALLRWPTSLSTPSSRSRYAASFPAADVKDALLIGGRGVTRMKRQRFAIARVLGLIVAGFTLTTTPALAAPSITSTFLHTDDRGQNPVGVGPGHRLVIGAFVSDPLGVPSNIASVTATALTPGQPSFSLPFFDGGPALGNIYVISPPYASQVGAWRITVTNNQGET